MPTNEEPKIVVDSDASPEMLARIQSMQREKIDDSIVVNDVTEQPVDEFGVDINLEEGGEQDTSGGEDPGVGSGTDTSQQDGGDVDSQGLPPEFQSFLKEKGIESEEDYLDKLFYNRTFKVKMGGKEKELPYSEIKSVLARGTTFQKKYNELEKSDEYKFGVLMKAAQEGNAEAQNALKQKLVEFTGADDADGMLDKLDDVEDEYDIEAALKDKLGDSEEDEHFADVKEDVDYKKNLGIVEADMKEFMPPKIWKAFWDAPEDRRAMYNLAATGKVKEINDLFQSHLQSLPLEKQLEIESDPDLYGRAFITVTNRVLKPQQAKQVGGSSDEADTQNVQQVSDGSRGRVVRKSSSAVPDFMRMPREEFLEWRRKNGLDH